MKKLVYSILLICSAFVNAQQKQEEDTLWTKAGTFNLLFNQSAYNNSWQGGGVSSIATNANVNYSIDYKKDDIIWENKFIFAYGLSKIEGNGGLQKTDDRIEISSTYGKQANKYWYYSAYINLTTQFAEGLDDDDVRISDFFSPAYLQAGPGFLWKKSKNLKVNITPASSRAIFVNSEFTEDSDAYGVEQGKTNRFELGANIAAYYKAELFKNVTFENTLALYSNYIEDLGNIDIDYTLNIVMKVNSHLSAHVIGQVIYDDNSIAEVQLREVFGIGFNCKL